MFVDFGQPWTKKRDLRIDKSGTFSLRKFKFFHEGQWASFEAYNSEEYLEDRQRRDHAQVAKSQREQRFEAKKLDLVLVEKNSTPDQLKKEGYL
jgi:hypothetical protein